MSVLMAAVPPHERPRERLLAHGAEALAIASDHAGVLKRCPRRERARSRRRPPRRVRQPGATRSGASGGARGRARRRAAKAAGWSGRSTSPAEPRRAFQIRLPLRTPGTSLWWRRAAGGPAERVIVLVADAANRLQRTVMVSEGAIDRSIMPVREILNAVLRHDGRAFAITPNHPSGDATPSDADRRATADVAAARWTRPPRRGRRIVWHGLGFGEHSTAELAHARWSAARLPAPWPGPPGTAARPGDALRGLGGSRPMGRGTHRARPVAGPGQPPGQRQRLWPDMPSRGADARTCTTPSPWSTRLRTRPRDDQPATDPIPAPTGDAVTAVTAVTQDAGTQ